MVVLAPAPYFFCIQTTGGDEPKTWPVDYEIRYCIDSAMPPFMTLIIESAGNAVLNHVGVRSSGNSSISIKKVNYGEHADVRITMGYGPSECHLGKTGDRRTTGWTAKIGLGPNSLSDVPTHEELRCRAIHMWGHIVGLPHSLNHHITEWDRDALKSISASTVDTNTLVDQVNRCKGNPKVGTSWTVMRSDPHPRFVLNPEITHQRLSVKTYVDQEMVAALAVIYPSTPRIHFNNFALDSLPGFSARCESYTGRQTVSTSCTHNILSALSLIHIKFWENALDKFEEMVDNKQDIPPPYRNATDISADTYIDEISPQRGYRINLMSWVGAKSPFNLKSNTVSFLPDDDRIRVGKISTVSNGNRDNASLRSEFSTWVFFDKSFPPVNGETPYIEVQIFLKAFRTSSGANTRVSVAVEGTNSDGFRAKLWTWGDTKAYFIEASYIAYRKDDPTIRSGRYSGRFFDNNYAGPFPLEDRSIVQLTPPMKYPPSVIFCGMSMIDTPDRKPIRLRVDASPRNEREFELSMGTWDQRTRYYQMNASWVAFL